MIHRTLALGTGDRSGGTYTRRSMTKSSPLAYPGLHHRDRGPRRHGDPRQWPHDDAGEELGPDRRRHGKMGEQGGVGEGRGTGVAVARSRSIRPGVGRVKPQRSGPASDPWIRFMIAVSAPLSAREVSRAVYHKFEAAKILGIELPDTLLASRRRGDPITRAPLFNHLVCGGQ
jgi:hypothetical protein